MSARSSSSTTGDRRPLAGRHALVTGAVRGIGAACAKELARPGATLTLAGRTLAPLEALAASLASTGTSAQVVTLDVTDQEGVRDAVARARAAAPIDILVNNAGAVASAPLARTDLALWERMLATNATGAYLCAQAVLPEMTRARWGRIVNVASTAGLRGYGYVTAYTAAKHALVGFTRALALEVARTGVTVNAVCPGYTETEMLTGAASEISRTTGRTLDESRSELVKVNPQGRFVQPADVAAAVGWLCLTEAGAITGAAIPVAGGEI